MTRALPLLLLAPLLALAPQRLEGCAAVGPDGGRFDALSESAVVVWDEATKTQHFIRRGQFRGTGYDFGFLVPTPTKPELAVADAGLFAELARVTAPKTETRVSYSIGGCAGAPAMATADVGPAGGLTVEVKKVGEYDAATLGFVVGKGGDAAGGAAEIAAWLKKHGYSFSPSLAAWLKPYVERQWLVTAFRVSAPKPADPPKDSKTHTVPLAPIRMSFRTERPFYPYREPAEMRDEEAAQQARSLRVYFVGGVRFAGKLGDAGSWPAKTVWANKLGDADRTALAAAMLPAGELWLTEFEDYSRPRPGTDEVYFEPSADQAAVARPPHIHVVYDSRPILIGGGFGAVVAVGFMMWAGRRKG